MKYYRMSYKEVVYSRAYINVILLNASIPGTKPVEKNDRDSIQPTKEKKIHANNYFSQFM